MGDNVSIEDILNQAHIKGTVNELSEVLADHFEDLESVVILWQTTGAVHHRAYGTLNEVLGLMDKAKFIMLRENIGATQ